MDTVTQTPAPTSNPQPAIGGSNSTTNSGSEKPALSSDFETFLKMLTAQMRNQDPLNPIESADFAVQLATFSNVEQQVRTNQLLESLGDRMGAMGMAQLSGWVGMEARAQVPVQFDGTPVTLTLTPDKLADAAQLVVSDANGTVVQRIDVAPQVDQAIWTGVDAAGVPLPEGRYTAELASFNSGQHLSDSPVQVHGRIVEARNADGQITLVMDGGQEVASEKILSLRAPDG